MPRLVPWSKKNSRGGLHSSVDTVAVHLQQVEVFAGLEEKALERVAEIFVMRGCVRGTVFFTPEDAAERLFVLKSGQAELYRLTPGGRRLMMRRIGPGTIFGEMGLLGQSMQHCFAEALEDSLVCVGTRDDVLTILRSNPDVALAMLDAVGRRSSIWRSSWSRRLSARCGPGWLGFCWPMPARRAAWSPVIPTSR
ncbi:MAG: cyclic nucleotide-binding domain-containing protein [SAR202 cluster bacterium]|nr:cyclic nucleotide-binding domain-containing protein [SAR202 cluster bacterium]